MSVLRDSDIARALSCNRFSGLVQSHHDGTTIELQQFVESLRICSSHEGRNTRLAPRAPIRLKASWDFHCSLRSGHSHGLADTSFLYSRAVCVCPVILIADPPAALRSTEKCRDYYANYGCAGYAFHGLAFETLGSFQSQRHVMPGRGDPPKGLKNCVQGPWDGLKFSHARMLPPGFESRSAQSHLWSFRTGSWAGCVLGFWWFPFYGLHMFSSTWSDAEALSEYVVTKWFIH
jgi:hypothetical protein